ncbi:MAG TPA: zinc ABC transporter substrate-binding protein, partial [Rhizobiaceae bacterium]|nr:zinc ABC transporter substrate-binding protein [Rhizobiaceae bacterium]
GHENGHGRDHADKAEKDDGHNHGTAAKAGHDHDQGHDNDDEHGVVDAHVWLDPVNAKAFIHEIGEALVEVDPKNADRYKANVEKVAAKLDALVAEIDAELKPVKGRGYVVFHDAYQYFENRFAMTAAGSITVSPEVMPGAERVSEIRARVRELGAACVFAEPQFEPRLVATVTEGTQSRSGVLDPLGAGIENGPDLYYQLIRNLAGSMKSCLTQAS